MNGFEANHAILLTDKKGTPRRMPLTFSGSTNLRIIHIPLNPMDYTKNPLCTFNRVCTFIHAAAPLFRPLGYFKCNAQETINYLNMKEVPYYMDKDEALTTISIIILLFSAMINWNIYSWLILVAIILILTAWYFKK